MAKTAASLRLWERLPDPPPSIHPVPEYEADGQLKDWYDDMKKVLRVPWMGVVTMAYAHYPTFFETLWTALRPLCESAAYADAGYRIRAAAEEGAAQHLAPPPIAHRLADMGYAPREIQNVRDMIEIFSHGNAAYYALVMMTTLLIEGYALGEQGEPKRKNMSQAIEAGVPFVLMEAHHADAPTRAVFEDVKATLGLPFVNTDYRALARWPSYFALAWADLKPHIGTAEHRAVAEAVHNVARTCVLNLPSPPGLHSAKLQAAAAKDAPLEEVQAMCRLFHTLIPGLMTNVAFFRAQLAT